MDKDNVTLQSLAVMIDELAQSTAKGFAAVHEELADIKQTMATKDDIVDLKNLHLAELTRRSERLEERVYH